MRKFIKKSVLFSTVAFFALPVMGAAAMSGAVLENTSYSAYQLVSETSEGDRAQAFVNKMGQRAISFLSDPSLSPSQKQKEFKKLLKNSFDMKTIGRFAMGRHWRSASKAEKAEYLRLFEVMIVDVYSARFNNYKGQKLDVSSHRADGKRDFLVNSYIIPDAGSKIKVDWRVRNRDGKFKVIDVIIEGVSMSLTQRSDFSSVIQRGGGNIGVLIAHLKK